MEFVHEFDVPSDVDTTFRTLSDLEAVAPCMPGATLTGHEGNVYQGEVKVRLGPLQMAYAGRVTLVNADRATASISIVADGREARGSGTAKAGVVATLSPNGAATRVAVYTDLQITGKAGQFGRGLLGEVGSNIISTFADRLRVMLASNDHAAASDDGRRLVAADSAAGQREDEPLDAMAIAGRALAKRLAPALVVVVVAAALAWWLAAR